ncbi:ubiquitin-associated domain-containing protein 2-like [Oscarella lobularis]|uniref:ubiquitin-associated domain-containing protein 2-like n=1 Tax=Oscarella lobularis TaxID=121494 RepID=UPI00331330C7
MERRQEISAFLGSPVTKGLLAVGCAGTLASKLSGSRFSAGLESNSLANPSTFLKLIGCHFVSEEFRDWAVSSALLYSFRILERRYGSRKFANTLFATAVMSTCLKVGVCLWHATTSRSGGVYLPSGPYSLAFSLLVPFALDVPVISHTFVPHLMTFFFALMYALSAAPGSLILSACGLVSGLVCRRFQCEWLRIPNWATHWISRRIGPLVDSAPPSPSSYPRGATLQLQRQERIDEYERLLLQGAPPHIDWQNVHVPNAAAAAAVVVVDEHKVRQLMEMGFGRQAVVQALTVTQNNVELAMNILAR